MSKPCEHEWEIEASLTEVEGGLGSKVETGITCKRCRCAVLFARDGVWAPVLETPVLISSGQQPS